MLYPAGKGVKDAPPQDAHDDRPPCWTHVAEPG